MPSKKARRPATPPSEESCDEEDGGFVVDPDQIFDLLPQPFRLVDKILTHIFDAAWEVIEDIEHGRDERRSKAQLPVYDCGRHLFEFKQISGLMSVEDGNILIVAHSLGLTAVDALLGHVVASYEEPQEKTVHMSACSLQNGFCLVCALDEKGVARVYCFSEDQVRLVKVLNEQDVIASVLEISSDGSYLGVGWEVPNKESWLELYKIPKDSWIKEMETSLNQQRARKATVVSEPPQGSLASLDSGSSEHLKPSEDHDAASVHSSPPHSRPSSAQGGTAPVAASFSKPTTVLKIRPPAVPTPCHASNSAAALKSIDGECSVIGSGVNHVLLPQYFQHSDATFGALHEAQLQHLKSDEQSVTCAPQFHFLVPNRLVASGLDTAPSKPNSVAVRWTEGTQLFVYSLVKSGKDLEQKPDVVWPSTDSIVVSATSSCATLLAFGLSNGSVVVWDVYRGMLLKVISVTERGRIELLHFLPSGVVPVLSDEQADQQLSSPLANLVVSCDDGTFGIIQCGVTHSSSLVPLIDGSSRETEVITSIQPLSRVPQVIVAGKDTGRVTLYDVKTCRAICHVSISGGYSLDTSVKPHIAAEGQVMVVKGQLVEEDEDSQEEMGCVFSFPLRSLPSLDPYWREAVDVQPYVSDNTIETRFQSMILDRVASQGTRQLRMEDRWSRFQVELKKMQAEKGRKGNTFWLRSNTSVYSVG